MTDGLRDARRAVKRAREREEAERRARSTGAAERAAVLRVRTMHGKSGVHRFLLENGLSVASFALFLLTLVGLVFTGAAVYSDDQRDHGQPPVTVVEYLRTGAFVETLAENWESEFLQMGIFVLLTAKLYQIGSAESKHLAEPEETDEDPRTHRHDPDAPWPVRAGGVALAVYRHSLSLALLLLFAASFVLHAMGGARAYSEEQLQHGRHAVSTLQYMVSSQFWFESLQNWQSEFLSVGVLVLLSIWLREQGSTQSKPVAAPSAETGH
jgi:hypothetical protein